MWELIGNIFVYGFLALFIGISQTAGIGGGPLLNVCLMLGLGYGVKQSMSITYLFLLGGSVASFISNKDKKKPNSDKPLIDYCLVMTSMPMTIAGAVFGTIFNHFISEFIVTIAFAGLLSYLAINSYKKYKSSMAPIPGLQKLQSKLNQQYQLQDMQKTPQSEKLQQVLRKEREDMPKKRVQIFILIIVVTIIMILLKGGSSFPSIIGIDSCGMVGWIFVLAQIAFCYTISNKIAEQELEIQEAKVAEGMIIPNSDKVTPEYISLAMKLGFAAGFTGGMLGIGGSIILVPVWMEFGIDKTVASTSSSPLIFGSALTSMTVAIFCHMYHSAFRFSFHIILGFVASYYVKKLIGYIRDKYKLEGMVFILLIITMVLSLVFLIPFEIGRLISNPDQFFAFDRLC